MKLNKRFFAITLSGLIYTVIMSSCGEVINTQKPADGDVSQSIKTLVTSEFNAFLENSFHQTLARSPVMMDWTGDYSANNRWDNYSEGFTSETNNILKGQLNALRKFSRTQLNKSDKLSFDLFAYETIMAIDQHRFRYHEYLVNQFLGIQDEPITHLINMHKIDDLADAEAYIERLNKLPALFAQVVSHLKTAQERGIIAPRFALELAADQMRNLITGRPYQADAKNDNLLLADFKKKVSALSTPTAKQAELIDRAARIMNISIKPAFENLLSETLTLASKAQNNGAWALPDGADYYQHRLKRFTTTNLSPEQIHQLGLDEIKRIHGEIERIVKSIGYSKDLPSFFRYTLEDPKFFYTRDKAGQQQAIADAERYLNEFRKKWDQWFITKPDADLIIKIVEPFREATSPVAFYQTGASDGSRPGIYYINTYNPKEMPKWQMPAVTYHEGIPGHHFQSSISQALEDLPSFRNFLSYSAYGEGWGLYSEYLPKEAGLYQNPYDDYGRLVWELLRACRLVADTGIHHKRWSREQAIEFMLANMPITRERATRSVHRYFVWPGQATAYKVGQLKIMELRQKAMDYLGKDFDIREFHEVVLINGEVPLDILEQLVLSWMHEKRNTKAA
jgi:uncharacterized protein (DUF885 family)